MAGQGNTTKVGLGWSHQQARKRALAAMRDGDPCPFCQLPMFRAQRLDYDHYPGRRYGGPQVMRLSHSRCNRRAGAIAGNRMRARKPRATTYTRW